MPPTLASLFDEHAAPQYCGRAGVHAQLAPILQVATDVQKQVLEYRARLMEEEMNGDPDLQPKFEHIHQTLGAIERRAKVVADEGRALARDFIQLDRYMAETKADFERMAAAKTEAPADGPQAAE